MATSLELIPEINSLKNKYIERSNFDSLGERADILKVLMNKRLKKETYLSVLENYLSDFKGAYLQEEFEALGTLKEKLEKDLTRSKLYKSGNKRAEDLTLQTNEIINVIDKYLNNGVHESTYLDVSKNYLLSNVKNGIQDDPKKMEFIHNNARGAVLNEIGKISRENQRKLYEFDAFQNKISDYWIKEKDKEIQPKESALEKIAKKSKKRVLEKKKFGFQGKKFNSFTNMPSKGVFSWLKNLWYTKIKRDPFVFEGNENSIYQQIDAFTEGKENLCFKNVYQKPNGDYAVALKVNKLCFGKLKEEEKGTIDKYIEKVELIRRKFADWERKSIGTQTA